MYEGSIRPISNLYQGCITAVLRMYNCTLQHEEYLNKKPRHVSAGRVIYTLFILTN